MSSMIIFHVLSYVSHCVVALMGPQVLNTMAEGFELLSITAEGQTKKTREIVAVGLSNVYFPY